MLKFHCHYPLLELGVYQAQFALPLTRKQVLGQLLGDGASAAAAAVAAHKGLEEHTRKTACIDAGVVVETHVLGGYQCVDEVEVLSAIGYLTIGEAGAVLDAYVSKYFAVGAPHLRCQVATRVFKLLERRHKAQPSEREHCEEQHKHNPKGRETEPHYAYASARVFL